VLFGLATGQKRTGWLFQVAQVFYC